jgi:hypothetical protein
MDTWTASPAGQTRTSLLLSATGSPHNQQNRYNFPNRLPAGRRISEQTAGSKTWVGCDSLDLLQGNQISHSGPGAASLGLQPCRFTGQV